MNLSLSRAATTAWMVLSLLTACVGTGDGSSPAVAHPAGALVNPEPGSAPFRRVRLEQRVRLASLPADARRVRVWLPLPQTDSAQSVTDLVVLAPVPHRVTREASYKTRMAYLELEAPLPTELEIRMSCIVERRETRGVERLSEGMDASRLLAGDRLAPLNAEVRTRASESIRGRDSLSPRARGIYDRVLADVRYEKSGSGWGLGDLEYVCANGKGNCSDFHTLFIAMARAAEIPALFEIGVSLPVDRSEGTITGYHCWAWYRDAGETWRPVDISEADKSPARADYFFGTLDENRIALSRGRDLVLEPPQEGAPLNFFIAPYVEVDGVADPTRVEAELRFEDL